jgi:hypothetical protein
MVMTDCGSHDSTQMINPQALWERIFQTVCLSHRWQGRMTHPWNLVLYAFAGLAGGLLALRTGIPAAPLAGALLGAGCLSMFAPVDMAQWPTGTRTVLEIAIGTVIGTALTSGALAELRCSGAQPC